MGPSPRIACLDLDTFFVSVERLLDPTLVGKPVVVGGLNGRGVVTSASYEVRAFGVKSGMSIGEARRLAPHAVFVPVRHDAYGPYAARVKAVLERYCPVVQTASIDEFFLDFRGCERLYARAGDADADATIARVVREMRAVIFTETGLPASVGVGANRALAKMASGRAKPAGVFVVPRGGEREFVAELPLRKLPGLGPKAEERLKALGYERLGQLLDVPPGPVRARFARVLESVHRAAFPDEPPPLGDDRPAFHEHDPAGRLDGTLSNERTFREDVADPRTIADALNALAERVCWRARKRGLRARTISLKLRYADFHTLTRARTVAPTDEEVVVRRVVAELFREARTRSTPVRLLGVGLSHWDLPDAQETLPFGAAPSAPRVGAALDAVRSKFGFDAVRLGVARAISGEGG